jgi:uncharacterized protein (DUF1015 family)
VPTLCRFQAWRPAPGQTCAVASPPYDVVTSEEARQLASEQANRFLHISRPEINLASDVDEHDEAVYLAGRDKLQELIASGVLKASEKPGLWLYAQTMGTHHQVGLVACVTVADYDADIIKKHEKTRPDKEDDRTKHIDVLGAHDEPVFLTYRADPVVDELVKQVQTSAPYDDFQTADGVRHTLWDIPDAAVAQLEQRFVADIPYLYVADGHHRSAAASRVHALRAGRTGEHDRFLAVLFPDNQMQILPYHRVVKDSKGRSQAQLLQALRELMLLESSGRPEQIPAGHVGLYLGSSWYVAALPVEKVDPSDPVATLDCSLCQEKLLLPMFGIEDPRRDQQLSFVGGIRGMAALEASVDEGPYDLAIAMPATTMQQLLNVSDAGRLMPPKSTWFEPKLRSGLFVHRLDETY